MEYSSVSFHSVVLPVTDSTFLFAGEQAKRREQRIATQIATDKVFTVFFMVKYLPDIFIYIISPHEKFFKKHSQKEKRFGNKKEMPFRGLTKCEEYDIIFGSYSNKSKGA